MRFDRKFDTLTDTLNGRMNFCVENLDVAFWISFGEVKISINFKNTPTEIPPKPALLKSVGQINFNQHLIPKQGSIFSSLKRTRQSMGRYSRKQFRVYISFLTYVEICPLLGLRHRSSGWRR
jgi:hypothetical protein